MKTERRDALIGLLGMIKDISSKEYQRRAWIEGRGPECGDYDETVCNFLGIESGIIKDHTDFDMTSKQYNMLVAFRDKFEVFARNSDYFWPGDFIDTPEWTEITEKAKEVLETFHFDELVLQHRALVDFLKVITNIANTGTEAKRNDFDKMIFHFFYDGDPIIDDKNDELTEEQYDLLQELREKLKVFIKAHAVPREHIDTPEWTEITEIAQKVLKAFYWNGTAFYA